MNVRTIAFRTLLVTATAGVMLAPAAGATAASGNGRGPDVAAYWTAARRHAAIPRDLVVDRRGLGYLRHPDGALTPYGHDTPRADQLRAEPSPMAKPAPGGGGGGGGGDTTGPAITNRNPAINATIGSSYTFSADVSDPSGVKSVTFVIVYPGGTNTQSFSASSTNGTTWSSTLSGFTDGSWSWYVKATDRSKRGNTTTSDRTPFTVSTSTPPPSGGVVTNAQWPGSGTVQTAAGRLYFEMPANSAQTSWQGYVCSGTAVTEGAANGRSIILTAGHCVYDDSDKAFARNVLFIPDQSASGTPTDLNCSNDKFGCWSPSFGVVDVNYTTRTFPDNDAWDYAYYVVSDTGAHSGTGSYGALDATVGSLGISFSAPTVGVTTAALGYSYSDDPNFMYCQEGLDQVSSVNWWLGSCDLSGGASGGPWLQPVNSGSGPIVSINSWGYTYFPGMAGPKLSGSSASCVFDAAKAATLGGGNVVKSCP